MYYGQPGVANPMQGQMSQPVYGAGMAMPTQQPVNYPPQMPSGVPSGSFQTPYGVNTQARFRVRPVASYDEAKAVPTDFMGDTLVLIDQAHGFIYTKVLDSATGSSIFHAYQRVPDQAPPAPAPAPAPVLAYDAKAEIEGLRAELDSIKHELGLDNKEAAEK